jgi:biopolymer transport protein ExbB
MMEREGEEQIQYLEQYLGALLIIIGVEPMLGFLGTIIGLIRAFMAWEQLGSNITVSALASGIYQAMITTASGLSVAIPAYILYHLIVGKIKSHAQEITYYSEELLDILARSREGGVR